MKENYTGLFEDEIAELLRDMQHDDVIIIRGTLYRPACAICDDGINTAGADYFLEIDAHGSRSHVSRSDVVNRLAHSEFSIFWRYKR